MPRFILEQFQTTGLGIPYQGQFDPALVMLSIAIAILAAFVALSLAPRIAASGSPWGRWAWMSAGAFSMGGGIWAMHFIGMLAFSLPCGESYNPFGTLLSMIPGILASGVALRLIGSRQEPGLVRLSGGAVLMGAGIGAMHYSGMAAMQPQALLHYEPRLVALSVIVAVALAFISLAIRFYLRRHRVSDTTATLVAAPVMGLAVAGMHYTAMKAAVFLPATETLPTGLTLQSTLMASLIAVITLLIAAIALAGSIAGRQSELAAGLREEVGRRQAAEHAAESGFARLQAIFDAVADAIVTIGRDGHIQQWSSGAQRIFGYTPEEVIGQNLTMLMPEPHRSRHATYVNSFVDTREAKIIGIGRELTAIRKDGSEFPIELTVSEVRNGDEAFFTGILRDITERKRAEAELVRARDEAEAASLAKSQFLATMSHEIRTPMNGVLGMANLLLSTTLNDRQRRLVDNVSRSGQALLAIINDILDFAKIESGMFELTHMPFDLRESIAEMAELFTERCAKKGLEFVYFVAEDVPSRLIGDPMRLRQILVNLVGNSVKFTERGEILVEVSVGRSDEGVLLSFAVEDTGIGIPADQKSRIFESFHQVDGSLTRARGGSGLGLAITRQLVQLMGGEISVDSEPGRGSRFSFTARLEAAPLDGELPRGPRHLPRPLRALVADANAVSAHVLSLYLAAWKVEATIVMSIEEARGAWHDAAQPFDVAILDAKGLEDALDFAATVRAAPAVPRCEIILLSGLDDYMSDNAFANVDAAAVLPKPARPSELFSALVAISHGGKRPARAAKRRKRHASLPNFGARILIAEDNPVNQDVATGILELMGCRTVSAPNGRVAFRLVAQEKFDAILMDCEMPIMDGIEATRRIRELETMAQNLPEGQHPAHRIPIIALTAHAVGEVREQCLAAGMDDFLVKPFDDSQMAETLRRWLKPIGAPEPDKVDDEDAALACNDATVPAHEEVIDNAVIDSLLALARPGRPSPFIRALPRFLETAPEIVVAIHQTCANNDADALWRAAHSLKSSAGALGAKRLSQRCAEIELRARESGVDAARPLVDFLDDDLGAAIAGLQSIAGEIHEPA